MPTLYVCIVEKQPELNPLYLYIYMNLKKKKYTGWNGNSFDRIKIDYSKQIDKHCIDSKMNIINAKKPAAHSFQLPSLETAFPFSQEQLHSAHKQINIDKKKHIWHATFKM